MKKMEIRIIIKLAKLILENVGKLYLVHYRKILSCSNYSAEFKSQTASLSSIRQIRLSEVKNFFSHELCLMSNV